MQGQIRTRRHDIFANGVKSLDSAFATANDLGETAGMQFVLALPVALIEDNEADIREILQEMENAKDNSGSNA